MNPKENPTEYGKWILQLILDDPENWELVELADGKKLDAIFSEAEILRLTWGLWISRYFVVLIALTRKADQLGWDKATLEAVSKTVERLIATLIPSDSRIVRVGSMITNESEIYYLRSKVNLQLNNDQIIDRFELYLELETASEPMRERIWGSTEYNQ